MSIKCNVCYAWCPKEWKNKWVDLVAYCKHCSKYTMHDDTCDHASLIAPTHIVEHNVKTEHTASGPARINEDFVNEGLTYYTHQREDISFFKDKIEMGVFEECGCGKSAIVLAVAAHKFNKKEIDAMLIIAPNDVHRQWYTEQLPLWLHVPYESQCLYGRGGAKIFYEFEDDPELLQVVCINIDTFSTPSKWKEVVKWANNRKTFIVLDEATSIKNVKAQRTQRILYEFNQTVKRGKTIVNSVPLSVARAVLTGTPVTNGPMDLWSIFEFLRPNYFGRNWYAFENYYGMYTRMAVEDKEGKIREIDVPLTEEWWKKIKQCNTYAEARIICGCTEDTFHTVHSQSSYEGPYKHAAELKALIQPISRFRMLKDCVSMPEQVWNAKRVQMSDAQRACYTSMVNEYIATYSTHTATALNKIGAMIRLQQISSGFLCDKEILAAAENEAEETDNVIDSLYGLSSTVDVLPSEIMWIGSSNPKLEQLYRDVDEMAKPLIIITRFTAEAARIYDDLHKKYSVCLVTGWKRVGTIDEFKAGQYQIMVANIAAIAHGFNLQNSYVVLFYANTHSLELRLQAEGRIFRINQKHTCLYNDYICENSVDEMIVQSLRLKRNLLDYMRDPEVTMEELFAA